MDAKNRIVVYWVLVGMLMFMPQNGEARHSLHVEQDDVLVSGESLEGEASVLTVESDTSVFAKEKMADVDMGHPEQYIHQKRYLEKGSKFRNYFYEHIFVGANIGASKIYSSGGRSLEPGIPLSLFIGNQFNRLHGLRLSATYQRYSLSGRSNKYIKQAGMDLDYMFNLTSYLNGYNPSRIFSLSGTLGVGVLSSHLTEQGGAWVYKGQAGLHAAFHVRRVAEVFVEPFLAFATDQLDRSGNPSHYDLQYGVKAGVSVRFGREKEYLKNTTHNGNLFFEATEGLMFYNSATLAVNETMGTSCALSVGKWFDPLLGVRITGHASDYLWGSMSVASKQTRPAYEAHRRAALFGGRAEVLINPIHFAKRAREVHRPFDLNIALGGEMGNAVKSVYDGRATKNYYAGFTAALQALYNMNTSTSLFVEPRLLMTQTFNSTEIDRIFAVNAGVRFIRPTKEERKVRGKHEFEPGCFASAQLGGLKQMLNMKRMGDRQLNYAGGLALGYEPFAFGGVKLGVECLALNRDANAQYSVEGSKNKYDLQWHHTYGLLNTKMQLMFNLLNIYQGYDANRKLTVYLNFGPAYSLCVAQRNKLYGSGLPNGASPTVKSIKGDGAWALNGSMALDYRLTSRWSLYVEPELQYYLKENFIGKSELLDMKSLLIKFNIGTSFRF